MSDPRTTPSIFTRGAVDLSALRTPASSPAAAPSRPSSAGAAPAGAGGPGAAPNGGAPAGFPGAIFSLARGYFSFADGRTIAATLSRDCTVR